MYNQILTQIVQKGRHNNKLEQLKRVQQYIINRVKQCQNTKPLLTIEDVMESPLSQPLN